MSRRTDRTADADGLLATGTIAGHTETFTPAHRVGNDTPVVLACTVTMPLSVDDVVAALWVAAGNGILREDMTGPGDLHAVVVYTLVNHNGEVAIARRDLDAVADGTPAWEVGIQLRMAVVRAFGDGTAPPAPPGATFDLGPVATPAADHRADHRTRREGWAGLRIVTD